MRWLRPVVAVALTVVAAGGLGLTLGVTPAFADQSAPSACTASGYRAQAKIIFHRTATESYLDSVSVNVDKRAGEHNKVRIVVKDGDKTVFYYASQNTVTAGPFLFDYTGSPIPLHQTDPSDQYRADVTFDFDRGAGGTGNGAAPEGSDAANPDDSAARGADGDDGDSDDDSSAVRTDRGHSDASPASVEAPVRCTATVRF